MRRCTWFAGLLILAGCASTSPSGAPSANSAAPASTSISENKAARPFIPRGIDYTTAPEKIAFSSCAHQDQPQPMWSTITATEPDLFLFMGDNIYTSSTDKAEISEQYRKLHSIPGYQEAREKIPFMAIWDDGDFGTNNGGKDAPSRLAARQAFLDYWVYIRDSLPFGREGVYHSKTMGGLVTGRRRRQRVNGPAVRVIMLDTRSFRSPLKTETDPETQGTKIVPETDSKATLLGADQWRWLENELNAKADLYIVVSSIQLIATDHPYEKWANFPRERERFFQLIKKTKPKNLLVLSGDRHMASIAKTEISGWGTLYDVTASSINRPSNLPPEQDPSYLQLSYPQENFGLLTIDWKKKSMLVEIKDIEGKTVQSHSLKLK